MRYWRTPLDADLVTVPRGAVRVNRERCKGCGICIEFCPKQVLERSATFNAKGYHPPEVKAGACAAAGCVISVEWIAKSGQSTSQKWQLTHQAPALTSGGW